MTRVARYIWPVLFASLVLLLRDAHSEGPCERIVSLAPSVTELLFDLELGGNVVGRTRFCRYPPEASRIGEIGGFYDVSVEAIVSQNPTLIVALEESREPAQQASRFGSKVLVINHSSVSGIKESIRQVGDICGIPERAAATLAELQRREDAIRVPEGDQRLRTLVVVGRTGDGSGPSSIYISGSDGFYSDVLKLAGARNIHEKPTVALPLVSPEGILAINPDAIVEVLNVDDIAQADEARRGWERYSEVSAVKGGRVYVLTDDFASIPGPRYIDLAEKLAQLINHQGVAVQ